MLNHLDYQSTIKVPPSFHLIIPALQLLDYPTIIKNPMDLGTVKKKLKSGKYKTATEFQDDIQLIWDNCKRYNQEGSVINFFPLICSIYINKQSNLRNKRRSSSKNFYVPSLSLIIFSPLQFSQKI